MPSCTLCYADPYEVVTGSDWAALGCAVRCSASSNSAVDMSGMMAALEPSAVVACISSEPTRKTILAALDPAAMMERAGYAATRHAQSEVPAAKAFRFGWRGFLADMVGVGGDGRASRRNSPRFHLKRNYVVDEAGKLGVANR